MAIGVRIRDKTGAIILDLNDRITRVVGTVDTTTSNGSVVLPLLAGGTPWWYLNEPPRSATNICLPVISVSGTTLSWTFSPAANQVNSAVHLIVGLY